ncbi:MAG TPA: macro domain-containing protein, partial [Dehalococcoidia bacterium]
MKVLVGDLFKSQCQTWVNTVNCVGVMGRGVALEFRKRFPDMYRDYVERCGRGEVQLGKPYLFKSLIPPWILNFPTKDHWRGLSRLSDIVDGLHYLREHYEEWGIQSLAVPPLGSGQGQLDWAVVGPTLYRHLSQLAIPVELYAPYGTSEAEITAEFLTDRRSDKVSLRETTAVPLGLVATVEILNRIQQEPFRWPVGRIMIQKIAYFATSEGLPTGLSFTRGSFGPFSTDLKMG